MEGVDYASVDENQPPNVLLARQAGVKFTIVRGAYTSGGKVKPDLDMTRDRDAWGNAATWAATGRTTPGAFGAYLILGHSKVDPSPVEQAQTFIATYGKRRLGELPPTLDVEFRTGRVATGLTAEQALQRCEIALQTLQGYYGVVMTYTSTRVWKEDLGDLDSQPFESSPLWIKTGYVYKAGNRPHPESCPATPGELPRPWQPSRVLGPGAWVHQYQGDAKGYPGFSSTVDCNRFLVRDCTKQAVQPGSWIAQRLATYNCSDVVTFQRACGLSVDGVIGPATFAMLTA